MTSFPNGITPPSRNPHESGTYFGTNPKYGIAYRQQDNAFTWIEDVPRAQRMADSLAQMNWPRILTALARRVNPLLKDLLSGMNYYWVTDQAEYATDVMFQDAATLKPLYEKLVKHANLPRTFLAQRFVACGKRGKSFWGQGRSFFEYAQHGEVWLSFPGTFP